MGRDPGDLGQPIATKRGPLSLNQGLAGHDVSKPASLGGGNRLPRRDLPRRFLARGPNGRARKQTRADHRVLFHDSGFAKGHGNRTEGNRIGNKALKQALVGPLMEPKQNLGGTTALENRACKVGFARGEGSLP